MSPAALVARIRRSVVRSPFAPAVVLPRPTRSLVDYFAEHANRYPGFKFTDEPSRLYPQGALGSEFLGLLGEVSQAQLGTPRYPRAKPGQIIGASGVEAVYDKAIDGGLVAAHLPVDSSGRIAGPLRIPASKPRPTLRLTIDARLQRATTNALEDGMNSRAPRATIPPGGSAVVINPWTGGIYALASIPTYNQVAAANDPGYQRSSTPIRATSSRTVRSPASTRPDRRSSRSSPKPPCRPGVISPYTSLLCSGSFNLGGTIFRNVEAGVYESMTLHTALSQSCDTWFYRLGDLVYNHDPSAQGMLIQQWARKLGLGRTPPIDVTGASSGLIPTPSWFLKNEHFPWTEGQTVNLSIGQGALQVSPLQLAVAYSTLANGGTVVRPHVGDAILRGDSVQALRYPPVRRLKLVDLDAIRQGLYEAAHVGTSAAIFGTFPVPVAGKTGTAEAPPGDDHSWYASWAPADHPRVVVVVMIEHGGFGAEAAAPAAREIYQAFFGLKHWKPTTGG